MLTNCHINCIIPLLTWIQTYSSTDAYKSAQLPSPPPLPSMLLHLIVLKCALADLQLSSKIFSIVFLFPANYFEGCSCCFLCSHFYIAQNIIIVYLLEVVLVVFPWKHTIIAIIAEATHSLFHWSYILTFCFRTRPTYFP